MAAFQRKQFTPAEDQQLALFLADYPADNRGAQSIYKEFVVKHPSHSWEAWRNHYLRSAHDTIERKILAIHKERKDKLTLASAHSKASKEPRASEGNAAPPSAPAATASTSAGPAKKKKKAKTPTPSSSEDESSSDESDAGPSISRARKHKYTEEDFDLLVDAFLNPALTTNKDTYIWLAKHSDHTESSWQSYYNGHKTEVERAVNKKKKKAVKAFAKRDKQGKEKLAPAKSQPAPQDKQQDVGLDTEADKKKSDAKKERRRRERDEAEERLMDDARQRVQDKKSKGKEKEVLPPPSPHSPPARDPPSANTSAASVQPQKIMDGDTSSHQRSLSTSLPPPTAAKDTSTTSSAPKPSTIAGQRQPALTPRPDEEERVIESLGLRILNEWTRKDVWEMLAAPQGSRWTAAEWETIWQQDRVRYESLAADKFKELLALDEAEEEEEAGPQESTTVNSAEPAVQQQRGDLDAVDDTRPDAQSQSQAQPLNPSPPTPRPSQSPPPASSNSPSNVTSLQPSRHRFQQELSEVDEEAIVPSSVEPIEEANTPLAVTDALQVPTPSQGSSKLDTDDERFVEQLKRSTPAPAGELAPDVLDRVEEAEEGVAEVSEDAAPVRPEVSRARTPLPDDEMKWGWEFIESRFLSDDEDEQREEERQREEEKQKAEREEKERRRALRKEESRKREEEARNAASAASTAKTTSTTNQKEKPDAPAKAAPKFVVQVPPKSPKVPISTAARPAPPPSRNPSSRSASLASVAPTAPPSNTTSKRRRDAEPAPAAPRAPSPSTSIPRPASRRVSVVESAQPVSSKKRPREASEPDAVPADDSNRATKKIRRATSESEPRAPPVDADPSTLKGNLDRHARQLKLKRKDLVYLFSSSSAPVPHEFDRLMEVFEIWRERDDPEAEAFLTQRMWTSEEDKMLVEGTTVGLKDLVKRKGSEGALKTRRAFLEGYRPANTEGGKTRDSWRSFRKS